MREATGSRILAHRFRKRRPCTLGREYPQPHCRPGPIVPGELIMIAIYVAGGVFLVVAIVMLVVCRTRRITDASLSRLALIATIVSAGQGRCMLEP